MTTLNVETKQGKNQSIRAAGKIPAVLYGAGKSGVLLQIDALTFKKFYQEYGESHTFTLKTPEGDVEALIHSIQEHPVDNNIIHVDFYAIEKGKPVTVSVPVHFDGDFKVPGGVLVKSMTEIEMEVLPKDIPEDFHVDVSLLKELHDSVKISDLKLPASAKVSDLEASIASVTTQKEEVEDTRTIDDVESEHGGTDAPEDEKKAQ